MTISIAVATRNAQLTSYGTLLNTGTVKVYAGAPPADADTALSGQTLLGTCTFQATAFPAPAAGSMTANAITQDAAADASGTAAFYRAMKSDGTTVVEQGTVGQCATGGTCSFATNTMTIVTPPTNGGYLPGVGQVVTAAGVPAGTTISSLNSGTANTAGAVYGLSTSPGTIATEAVSAGWGDLQINNIAIVAGGPISISSFVRSM
jgi:hypothetical protein